MHLNEWARRHASAPREGSAIDDLRAQIDRSTIARERGLPAAALAGIATFYDQLDPAPRVCVGTACQFGGSAELRERLSPAGAVKDVRCLGHCYDAPACRVGDVIASRSSDDASRQSRDDAIAEARPRVIVPVPIPRASLAAVPAVLRHLLDSGTYALPDDYDLPSGDAILEALTHAQLRGRGGAAYPTAAKWRAARATPAPDRFVVANGDEGDPGSFVDRLLLEEDPHAVLAGMCACARAIGATQGIVYIRAEYPVAQQRMRAAIEVARSGGYFGRDFDVRVVSGGGSYVCGEETAVLNAIEGLRGEPRPKPPYPAQAGLFELPTVVQNVETLAIVPQIVRTGRGERTKAVSLSGAVARPGVVEVPLGTTVLRILEDGGGGAPAGRRWSMALIGGPMGRVLPARAFDTPLSYEDLPGMGHAGIVVLDDSVSPAALARHLFQFARDESCGLCTPCRAGTAQLAEVRDAPTMHRLLDTMAMGSMCGFGLGVPRPIRDLLAIHGSEVFARC